MFASIRSAIIAFFGFFTSLFTAASNGAVALEHLSEYGRDEAQLVKDRGTVKRSAELQELAKQLSK